MLRMMAILLLTAGLTSGAWANTTTDREPARALKAPIYPQGAIAFFTFVIEAGNVSKRELAHAFYKRGSFFSDLGQFKRAIEEFSRVVVLDPDNAGAYYKRANAYAALGRHGTAVEDYSAAIRLEPDHDFAFYNRANSYIAKGNRQRAVSDYKKAYALNPGDLVYQDKLRDLELFE